MEFGYNSQRTKNMFCASSKKPYKLSRSKIENFIRCPRCFYLDRKHGTEQPPMFPYTLNNAVDSLLKNEFDIYRSMNVAHPYVTEHGIDAVPFSHPQLNEWRTYQQGITYHHKPTNFIITGAVDDVWVNPQGELILVDYKAMCSTKDITFVGNSSYKRQIEVYQWLFRQNNFKVADIGYFVYCNANSQLKMFADALQFKVSVVPYKGNCSWIETILLDIKACLTSTELPEPSSTCDYCNYSEARAGHVAKYQ